MSKPLLATVLLLAGERTRAYAPRFQKSSWILKNGLRRDPYKVASVCITSATRRKASTQDEEEQLAESDPLVEVRSAGEGKGFGAFAKANIAAGVELGTYQGEHLTYAQLEKRYPNLEPDYVLRLSSNPANSSERNVENDEEELYVDAIASKHWSRFLNHGQYPNVVYTFRPSISCCCSSSHGSSSGSSISSSSSSSSGNSTPLEAVFHTTCAVAAGEELVFDYGVEYWDGRSSGGPAPSTDARPYSALGLLAARQDPSAAYLGTPVSSAALKDVIRATGSGATLSDQRAALGRALTYFGVDMEAIPLHDAPDILAGEVAGLNVAFENASLDELAAAVRSAIANADASAAADDGDESLSESLLWDGKGCGHGEDGDEDDDDDFDWSAWEEEKRAIEELYGSAADLE